MFRCLHAYSEYIAYKVSAVQEVPMCTNKYKKHIPFQPMCTGYVKK